MKENIVIYNVDEDEEGENTKALAEQFFVVQMKIGEDQSSQIKIDIAHRSQVGRAGKRPIIVKMKTRSSKQFVMSNAR